MQAALARGAWNEWVGQRPKACCGCLNEVYDRTTIAYYCLQCVYNGRIYYMTLIAEKSMRFKLRHQL